MSKTGYREKYRNLKIKFLILQSKYYKLKAELMEHKKEKIKLSEAETYRKKYLETLAKLRRCQAKQL